MNLLKVFSIISSMLQQTISHFVVKKKSRNSISLKYYKIIFISCYNVYYAKQFDAIRRLEYLASEINSTMSKHFVFRCYLAIALQWAIKCLKVVIRDRSHYSHRLQLKSLDHLVLRASLASAQWNRKRKTFNSISVKKFALLHGWKGRSCAGGGTSSCVIGSPFILRKITIN